jgi:Kef-type K+ transport system membrane component KefB
VPLYLLGGLAFGRGGLLPLVHSGAFIRTGAEIGLILLLFMLGLEYSARELLDGLRRTWWAAVLDVVLNFLPGLLAGLLLGWRTFPRSCSEASPSCPRPASSPRCSTTSIGPHGRRGGWSSRS